MKIRSRLCGAPASEADTVTHCVSYPRSASDPRTVPTARTSRRSCHWHRATARLRSPMTRMVRARQILARSRLPFWWARFCSLPSHSRSWPQASRDASAARCSAVGSSPRAVSSARTFSITTTRGRRIVMAVTISCHSPDRVPRRRPARAPAQEMSWQGKPAHKMSTGSTALQSVSVMSPRFLAAGKRCDKMAVAPGSLSATHASSPPSTSMTAAPRPS